MRRDIMLVHTAHFDTHAGCAPINSKQAAVFDSVVIVSTLGFFCSFFFFFLKTQSWPDDNATLFQ